MTKPDVLKHRSCAYRDYYVEQAGHGLSKVYVGANYQKGHGQQVGHGIGSFFSGLFRAAKLFLTKGVKFLVGKALSTGSQILSDVQKGENVKEAAKRRVNETYDELKQLYGSGNRIRVIPKRLKKRGPARNHYELGRRPERFSTFSPLANEMACCQVTKNELDLFESTPVQTSIEGGKWMTYQPVTSLRGDSIEFNVLSSGGEYLDLPLTYMYLKFKIVADAAGTSLGDDDDVAPCNNFLNTLFSQAEVHLNGTLLSPSASTYVYRSYVETLLNYGNDAKMSHLTAAMWHKDTAGKMNVLAENEDYKSRKALTSKSKEVELIGPLFLDIFNVEKFILNGVDLRVKLSRSKANFALMGEAKAGADYRIVISDATLLVRKVRVAPKIFLAHEAALAQSAAKYAYTRTETKIFTINSGVLSTTINNLHLGTMLNRVIIGLLDHDAYNGNLAKTPFCS